MVASLSSFSNSEKPVAEGVAGSDASGVGVGELSGILGGGSGGVLGSGVGVEVGAGTVAGSSVSAVSMISSEGPFWLSSRSSASH